jgi:hypothetical protein
MKKKDRKLIVEAYKLNNILFCFSVGYGDGVDVERKWLAAYCEHQQKVINRLEDELRKQVPE